MQLYLVRNGQSTGPFTVEQIQADIAAGRVTAADFGWHTGLPAWTPLAQIPGVLSLAAPAAGGALPAVPSPRPIMALIISIFYFTTVPLGLLVMLVAVGVSLSPHADNASLNQLSNLKASDYALSMLIMAANLGGAFSLFLMRRAAVYFFGAVLVLGPLSYVKMAFTGYYSTMEAPQLIGTIIGSFLGVGINLAIFLYTFYLYRGKRLR